MGSTRLSKFAPRAEGERERELSCPVGAWTVVCVTRRQTRSDGVGMRLRVRRYIPTEREVVPVVVTPLESVTDTVTV